MAVGTVVRTDEVLEDQVMRKCIRRLVSFLFVLFIFSYLDRINIGFAALQMNRELKLTAVMFGFSNTIFYIGYALCEIPSNICLRRFGARVWMARILITWGLASAATMFAVGPRSLYGVRLLVGIFEAGFLPGLFLYLTYWFPPTFRARATALVMIAQPVTNIIGASASGVIMQHLQGVMGLSGWRWLFLIEGVPAVILGIITYAYLTDGPDDAKWLTAEEKAALRRRLEREQQAAQPAQTAKSIWAWNELFSGKILLLAATYFCLVEGLNGNATWAPQIVREVLKGSSLSMVGLWIAIPSAIGLLCMILWSRHSDRKMERTWHYVLAALMAAVGWALIAWAGVPHLRLLGVVFTAGGAFTAMSTFWTVPPKILSPLARPVGIAFINMIGMISAALSPLVFGFLRDLTHSWKASVLFVAIMLVLSSLFMLAVNAKENLAPAAAKNG
jgi:ACS family 4-hydroxyphenylacetate permease-like MFS transporter